MRAEQHYQSIVSKFLMNDKESPTTASELIKVILEEYESQLRGGIGQMVQDERLMRILKEEALGSIKRELVGYFDRLKEENKELVNLDDLVKITRQFELVSCSFIEF